jgi:5-formyltetrahydrofolate cyclo-ligase
MRDKDLLREEFRARRRAMTRDDAAHLSARIAERLLAMPEVRAARTILSTIAFGREADTRAALAVLAAEGRRVLVPCADPCADAATALCEIGPGHPLLTGAAPKPAMALTAMESPLLPEVDIFLVPGIVWDPFGYRIGFGGGYFDRLLARARADALKVGVAYDWQVIDRLEPDAWDVPVDRIVTELRIVDCR